jgi:hypothetical protein
MAKSKAMAKTRRASPTMNKLRDQLGRANKRATAVRGELKKAYNPAVITTMAIAGAAGGAAAGAAQGVLGEDMMGKAASAAIVVLPMLIGAFMVKGATGATIAMIGVGALGKVAGDFTEDRMAE